MVLATLSAIAVIVVCMFTAWLHFTVQRDTKRQLSVLAASVCPSCGNAYGAEAAERARNEHLTGCHDEQKAHPDLRINFARFWDVRCPVCQMAARFNYETERLTADAA